MKGQFCPEHPKSKKIQEANVGLPGSKKYLNFLLVFIFRIIQQKLALEGAHDSPLQNIADDPDRAIADLVKEPASAPTLANSRIDAVGHVADLAQTGQLNPDGF